MTIGCGGIGGLAGAALAAPAATRWGPRRALIGALLVGGAVQVLIPLAPPVPAIAMTMLIATQVIGDGALTVYLINETTLRQRLLPAETLGRAAATWQVATGLLTPAGALAGAALAESIGMRPTLWMLAIGIALAAAWLVVPAARSPEELLAFTSDPRARRAARSCATRSSAPFPYCSSAARREKRTPSAA